LVCLLRIGNKFHLHQPQNL